MHKILFYKFIKRLYMFRALCGHHQDVKIVYRASSIITPVGGRLVHSFCITNFDVLLTVHLSIILVSQLDAQNLVL